MLVPAMLSLTKTSRLKRNITCIYKLGNVYLGGLPRCVHGETDCALHPVIPWLQRSGHSQ